MSHGLTLLKFEINCGAYNQVFYLLLQKASNKYTDSPTEVWMVWTKRDSKPKIFIEKCYRTSTCGICERLHGDCLHILTLFQIISITQYN